MKKILIYTVIVGLILLMFLISCSPKITQINTLDRYKVENVKRIKGTGQVVMEVTSQTSGEKLSVLDDDKNQKKGEMVYISFSKIRK